MSTQKEGNSDDLKSILSAYRFLKKKTLACAIKGIDSFRKSKSGEDYFLVRELFVELMSTEILKELSGCVIDYLQCPDSTYLHLQKLLLDSPLIMTYLSDIPIYDDSDSEHLISTKDDLILKMKDNIQQYWNYFSNKRNTLRRIVECAIKADSRYEPQNIHEFVFYHRLRRLSTQYFGISVGDETKTNLVIERGILVRNLHRYIGGCKNSNRNTGEEAEIEMEGETQQFLSHYSYSLMQSLMMKYYNDEPLSIKTEGDEEEEENDDDTDEIENDKEEDKEQMDIEDK